MTERIRIKINTPPHSPQQMLLMNAFAIPDLLEMWVACGSKFGKALHVDTPIPTPDGWKLMGELKEGDYVFDEHGSPTLVEFATDFMFEHNCYELTFTDGAKIIADEEHLWVTTTHQARKNIARAKTSTASKPEVVTTKQIKDTLLFKCNQHPPRPNHCIPLVSSPLEFTTKHLPIDPYVLGVWLGDGNTKGGMITNPDAQLLDEVRRRGFEVNHVSSTDYGERIVGLTALLNQHGFLGNKQVPEAYLVGDVEQRLALLQGLMDTDGTVCKKGKCCFDNTNLNIAQAVARLLTSFGIKWTWGERIGKFKGVLHKRCYRVYFTTDKPVFRLLRKAARLRPCADKATRRYVAKVEKVESVPVRCIRVSNPSHLFLAGEACIPTHNTFAASTALVTTAPINPQSLYRWVAPIYRQAKIGYDYTKRMLPPEPYVKGNDTGLVLKIPAIDTAMEFFHGQNPETLEGEATAGTILDEAAKMKEQVYHSVKTTTGVTAGPIIGISTPLGENWFHQKCMEAKQEMIDAKRQGRRPRKIFIHAPSTTNPTLSPSYLIDAKKSYTDRLYRQYILAEFVGTGAVFTNLNKAYYTEYMELGETFEWPPKPVYDDEVEPLEDMTVVIGVDWARMEDYTVFIASEPATRRVVAVWRMKGVPYPTQVRRLVDFSQRFKEVLTVWHDRTGVGVALDDMLGHTGLPFRGITFTNDSKNTMMVELILAFEEGVYDLPYIEAISREMNAIEVDQTPLGLARYNAPDGEHDDIVMSLALSHLAMKQHVERDYGILEF
jgi:hypothetical protein